MDTLELELSVAPEEMCRTCLAAVDRAQLKPIFCSEILDGKIVPFPKVVELTTGEKLTKNEKLPNNVCVECKAKLRELYLFVDKVRKSSNLLYEIFSVSKPEPPQTDQKGIESKTAEVQTEAIDVTENKIDQSTPPVVLVENGTQCDRTRPTLGTDASCQTEMLPRKETANTVQTICLNNFNATFEDVEKVSLISVDKESSASDPVPTEADEGTTNDADEYDMILVAEEPTEEECYALSTVKLKKKSKGKKAQAVAANQQQPTAEETTTREVSTRGLRAKQQHCEYCNFTCRAVTFVNHCQIHRQTLELCFESIDYYRCPTCYRTFISQTHFDEHFNEPCHPVLPEKYVEPSDLKKHELFYLRGLVDMCAPKLKTFKLTIADDLYRCARCPMHTKNFEDMRLHAQSHDVDDDLMEDMNLLWEENCLDKVHVCGLCQAQFPDALYIRQHLYFHQCSFFCPYSCSMSFDKFVNLTRHIHRVHLLDSKPESHVPDGTSEPVKLPCELCGRSFLHADALEAHVKRHYRERKYVCTVCKKCFAQKSDLTTHLRIHTDERPYRCEICGKTFRTTSHRRDHMATHEVVNKFECDVCQKLFKAERILAGHKRLHSGQKPFQCTVCEKAFARKHHLKLHSKVHQKAAQN
uniref:Uncharacterized protein n=1 Tax=Anopheles atroparvus TaxID=41427 RepID=A0AAG5DQT2_ANOAO